MRESRTTADELGIGDRVGPYRIEAVLGAGGMGVVFRATHEPDGDCVALKVLRAELSEDDVFRQRLAHEARSAQEVNQPHLVRFVGAGEADGHQYLAVEYVPGTTLEARVRELRPPRVLC